MPCHRSGDNAVPAVPEKTLLAPVEEIASRAYREKIKQQEHHQESERSGEDEVFRLGDLPCSVRIRLHTETVGIILEEKLHPAGPEEQGAEESEILVSGKTFG